MTKARSTPSVSVKSRALIFIALDKVHNQDLRQAIIVAAENTIGATDASTFQNLISV